LVGELSLRHNASHEAESTVALEDHIQRPGRRIARSFQAAHCVSNPAARDGRPAQKREGVRIAPDVYTVRLNPQDHEAVPLRTI
jgi:hypothetical protein